MQFWLIFFKIWLPWQLIGSLENLNSMLEFANPEKSTIHAKIVSISCTEISYAYLNVWRIFTIAGIGNFLNFC